MPIEDDNNDLEN